MNFLAENGPQHGAKKEDSERTRCAGPLTVIFDEPGADYHFAAGAFERRKDTRDVAGVVLAIAIDADHIFIAEFEGEFVASLNAAAKAEVVRQADDVGAGSLRDGDGVIGRAIIGDHHRNPGHVLVDGTND